MRRSTWKRKRVGRTSVGRIRSLMSPDQMRVKLKTDYNFQFSNDETTEQIYFEFWANRMRPNTSTEYSAVVPNGWQIYRQGWTKYYVGGCAIKITITNMHTDTMMSLNLAYATGSGDAPGLTQLPWTNMPNAKSVEVGPRDSNRAMRTMKWYNSTKKAYARTGQISNDDDYLGLTGVGGTSPVAPSNPFYGWQWRVAVKNEFPRTSPEVDDQFKFNLTITLTQYCTFSKRRLQSETYAEDYFVPDTVDG